MKKVEEFISKYLLLLIAILVIVIAVFSFFVTAYFDNATYAFTSEYTAYKIDNIILNILFIIIFLGLLYGINKITQKISTKIIFSVLIVISFVIQLIWIFAIKFIPYADQANVIDCAKELLAGQYDNFKSVSSYFGTCPHQLGIIYYIAFIFKLFNTDNFLVLQTINVIFSTINLFLMYKITNILFKNEKVQRIAMFLIFGFFIYFMFLDVHVYGIINGLTFALIASYYTLKYLENKKIRNIVITGICISIAILLKSNYNIFLCGIVIIYILEFLKDKKIRTIMGTISIIIMYLAINFIAKFSLEKIMGADIPKGIPMISYVYMGMAEKQTMSSGWYTGDHMKIYTENNFEYEKATEETVNKIKERLQYFKENPSELIKYYCDKLASTWLNPTYQTIWCSYPGATMLENEEYRNEIEQKTIVKSILSGTIYKIEEEYMNIYQIVVFSFAGYCLLKLFKQAEVKNLLLPIIFIGGFAFHLLWETKAIYVLQYYYLLLPFTAYGISKFYDYVEMKAKRKEMITEGNINIKPEERIK